MQKRHLRLAEIIWEICPTCNNNCSYCGSKEVTSIPVDENRIIKIAEAIAKYPPTKINISGGDPLLVSYDTHLKIKKLLDKTERAILVNPKSFIKALHVHEKLDIVGLYDWIGISINTKEELDSFRNLCTTYQNPSVNSIINKKMTVISNFNTTNVFMFDEIKRYVEVYECPWQIQFTMYKDENDEKAIYNNDEALKYFQSKVTEASKNVNIILADNCNNGQCGAGIHSLGITYDGKVIGCLSERSWKKYIDINIEGKLVSDSPLILGDTDFLEDIWLRRFQLQRFSEFKCCKDHCKNKVVQQTACVKLVTTAGETTVTWPEPNKICPIPYQPIVTLYGVNVPPAMAYAVSGGGTYVYAVFTPDTPLVYGVSSNDVDVYGVFSSSDTIDFNKGTLNQKEINELLKGMDEK